MLKKKTTIKKNNVCQLHNNALHIIKHDSLPFVLHSTVETYFSTVSTVVAPPNDSKHSFTRHAARSHVIWNPRGRRFDFHGA